MIIARNNDLSDNLKWLLFNHWDATRHKTWVIWFMVKVCIALIRRAIVHDLSKYSTEEAASFKAWSLAMQGLTYGTEEYKRVSASFAKDNELHYKANKHHPEYWPNGIRDMSSLDLIEMLVDWKAKTVTKQGTGIVKSIEINAGKFDYNEQLKNGLIRDATEAFN